MIEPPVALIAMPLVDKDNLPLSIMTIGESIAAILPQLKRAARNIARGEHYAEDIMQDVILAVIECNSDSANAAAQSPNDMFVYMIRCMINAHINLKKRPQMVSLHEYKAINNTSSNIDMSARADNELIDFAINFLGEPDRQIFLLYAFVDFDFEKLSAETGIPKPTIYTSVHRSRTKLRQWIERR